MGGSWHLLRIGALIAEGWLMIGIQIAEFAEQSSSICRARGGASGTRHGGFAIPLFSQRGGQRLAVAGYRCVDGYGAASIRFSAAAVRWFIGARRIGTTGPRTSAKRASRLCNNA